MQRFHNKVAVIAGGAAGIGAATCRRLAAEGAAVVVGDLDETRASMLAEEIRAGSGIATAVEFDATDEASVRALFATAVELYGGVDAVHANVADLSTPVIGRDVDALDLPDDVFERSLRANTLSHIYCARYGVPELLRRAGGGIAFTSSGAADIGDPVNPAYAISKAGVQALARHVASRWGQQGVRANAVAPGMVLSGHQREKTTAFRNAGEKVLASMRSPRLGRAEDIAAAVAFLLSEDATWINGQVLGVDGGLILR